MSLTRFQENFSVLFVCASMWACINELKIPTLQSSLISPGAFGENNNEYVKKKLNNLATAATNVTAKLSSQKPVIRLFCYLKQNQNNRESIRCVLLSDNSFVLTVYLSYFVSTNSKNVVPGSWVIRPIGHVRYINILTWLRGFRVKLLYLVLFSLYSSLFWELRDKRNLKNLQFWPESLGAMLQYWYIERSLLSLPTR